MMNSVSISFNRQEQLLLNRLGVMLLVFFGSRAQNLVHEKSDYDFGVLRDPATRTLSDEEIYDQLYDLLAAKINQLVDIDIVFLQKAPMELQYHVSKYGVVLYEKTPDIFPDYREQVMNRYADFAPLRSIFQTATLNRI